jgi:restriction system protein
MTEDQHRVWGIHGGRTGDAETLFLRQARIALGCSALSSLANLPPAREAFKQAAAAACPDKKLGAIPNNVGQLFEGSLSFDQHPVVASPHHNRRKIAYRHEIPCHEHGSAGCHGQRCITSGDHGVDRASA